MVAVIGLTTPKPVIARTTQVAGFIKPGRLMFSSLCLMWRSGPWRVANGDRGRLPGCSCK